MSGNHLRVIERWPKSTVDSENSKVGAAIERMEDDDHNVSSLESELAARKPKQEYNIPKRRDFGFADTNIEPDSALFDIGLDLFKQHGTQIWMEAVWR